MKKILLSFAILFAFNYTSKSQTWITQDDNFPEVSAGVYDISVVNNNIAWALAYDGSGKSQNLIDVSRTIDGGTTWTASTVGTDTTFAFANISAVNGNTA